MHNPARIPDEQINVTSSLSSQYDGSHARYNDEYGWVAGVNDADQHILIDTGGLPVITKVWGSALFDKSHNLGYIVVYWYRFASLALPYGERLNCSKIAIPGKGGDGDGQKEMAYEYALLSHLHYM